jgi:hypothetical protein
MLHFSNGYIFKISIERESMLQSRERICRRVEKRGEERRGEKRTRKEKK